jgi:hypothetical protein
LALAVLLLVVKLAFMLALLIACVIGVVVILASLSGKRLRSTSQTRPPSIT